MSTLSIPEAFGLTGVTLLGVALVMGFIRMGDYGDVIEVVVGWIAFALAVAMFIAATWTAALS